MRAQRTRILWRVNVWRDGAWRKWSGDSGDLRLSGIKRDQHAEGTQRREAERLAALGRVVRLSRLGETIDTYNLSKLSREERARAWYDQPKENA